jgi:hypothetical protein
MKELSQLEEMLLLACSGSDNSARVRQLYYSVGDSEAWAAAAEHELCGHVAHKLSDAHATIPSRWEEAHEATAQRIGAYLAAVNQLAAQLAEIGIPVIALKNAGIAQGIFTCLGCSPMGDVDLLVRRADFARAHELLVANGYKCRSRCVLEQGTLEEGQMTGGTEYSRELDGIGEFWLELQWRAVSGRWIRPDQEPDSDDLMARSVAIPRTKLRLLSPEDNLLQVGLHTAKHSYVRAPGLRLHTDVDRIVRNTQIDWALFVSQVEKLQVRTAVYLSLALAKELLETPVPDAVLDTLRPPRQREKLLRRAIVKAGLFHPSEHKFSRLQYLLFTAMLYDDAGGLLRAVVPDSAWMKRRYNTQSSILLPVCYLRRIWDLAVRRVGI